jgi:Uri superfamily endonuclease
MLNMHDCVSMDVTASFLDVLPPQPGAYALWLQVTEPLTLRVGSLGEATVTPGDWVYVGSALGPGGLRARVAHHARIARRPHWHIDYLRRHAVLTMVWHSVDLLRREHQWARLFQDLGGVAALPRFGSSDCQCPAHLFHFPHRPDGATFVESVRARYPNHPPVGL